MPAEAVCPRHSEVILMHHVLAGALRRLVRCGVLLLVVKFQ